MDTKTPEPDAEGDLRPHAYDGIREYDKRLPNWWLFTLYAMIVFWLGYWAYFEWLRAGPSGPEKVDREMARIEAAKLAAVASSGLDDATLWRMSRNPEFVGAGRATFESMCASCHKSSLRGVDDGGIVFYGSEATLKIDRARLAVYPEGEPAVPGTLTPEPEILVRAEHDGTLDNVKNFLDCMRTRKAPNADIHVGFEAARTSWIGNAALRHGMKVAWDAAKGRVA